MLGLAHILDVGLEKEGLGELPARDHLLPVLLLLGFFGGAFGALLAMKVFRHKTKHIYFWIVNLVGLAFQLFLLFVLFQK